MPLENYRELPLKLNGQDIRVGGFKRPDGLDVFTSLKNTHNVEAVISLTGDYNAWVTEAGMSPASYTRGPKVEVYDWFNTPYAPDHRINPTVYDCIYEAVTAAQKAHKKIAIHCGAGDGRTGTALASLKLRELLEQAQQINPTEFNQQAKADQKIHMHYGVVGQAGGNVQVTPLVKKAIEEVRRLSAHPNSVESRNDVESLMLYEQHLRNQLTLEKGLAEEEGWEFELVERDRLEPSEESFEIIEKSEVESLEGMAYDDSQAQLNAALMAIECGTPQASEAIAQRLLGGISCAWNALKESLSSQASPPTATIRQH